MNRFSAALFSVLILSAFGTSSSDATVTFSGLSGDLAAQADFTVSGNTLTVVLTNTSTADVLVPADLLTAVFFDITGYPPASFSPVSAMLSGGSTVFFGPDGGGNVGGEWVFASGLSGAPDNATLGISSAGFGLFGDGNFNGPNLEGADGVNGLNYGLLSAGDNTTTGNAAVTGGSPLIQNQVTFTLTGSAPFLESAITNVSFQYGTSLREPNVPSNGDNPPPVPEPSTMLLLGVALTGTGGIGFLRRRKGRAQ